MVAPAEEASHVAIEAKTSGLEPILAYVTEADEPGAREGQERIAWNPSSFASARALATMLSNAPHRLAYAVIAPYFPERRTLAEISAAEIDSVADHSLSGPLRLFKELSALRASGHDDLRVAFLLRKKEEARDLEGVAWEASRAACETIADSFPDWCICVVDECPQRELTAQFVVKALTAQPFKQGGKTVRFTGKSGLFGIL